MYTIRVTGRDWWEKRIYYLSRGGGIHREATNPTLKKLSRKYRDTLTKLFAPTYGGPGVPYAHGYTGRYLMNLHNIVTWDTLQIVEGVSTGGREIREGGKPGSYNELVQWARDKLRVDKASAKRIATVVTKRGFVGGGKSPMKNEHPVGQGKFLYPEWIVMIKHRRDLQSAVNDIGSLVVRYLN